MQMKPRDFRLTVCNGISRIRYLRKRVLSSRREHLASYGHAVRIFSSVVSPPCAATAYESAASDSFGSALEYRFASRACLW